jgi:hypothetical protein
LHFDVASKSTRLKPYMVARENGFPIPGDHRTPLEPVHRASREASGVPKMPLEMFAAFQAEKQR